MRPVDHGTVKSWGRCRHRQLGAQHVEDRVKVFAQPVVVDWPARTAMLTQQIRRECGLLPVGRIGWGSGIGVTPGAGIHAALTSRHSRDVVCRCQARRALCPVVRYTTFRFCLDPTVEQAAVLSRHAGASRFAFNTCLRLVKTALEAKQTGVSVKVPWTGFDLVNAFNAWKRSEAAGRIITVDAAGDAEIEVTGLRWRGEVSAQVFEEAAVDLGKALGAFADSRKGTRAGRRVGFPRFKKKSKAVESFRLRNKHPKNGKPCIRLGDGGIARSVTLPGIGRVRVHDDTRRLRRMLAAGRGKILFATVSRRGGHWFVSLNVQAADLHPAQQHEPGSSTAWVGVDRGLHDLAVAADETGTEIARFPHQKHLKTAMARQRRLARAVTGKKKGSNNRRRAAVRLGTHHLTVRNRRHHALHEISNVLTQYPRVALEDLNIAGMLHNRHLAASIGDAAWAELARIIGYKQAWKNGTVMTVDRWFPSSKTCSACGHVREQLDLSERTFRCRNCQISIDRDLNAATNIAAWARSHAPDPQAEGRDTNARREDSTGQPSTAGEPGPCDAGTRTHAPA